MPPVQTPPDAVATFGRTNARQLVSCRVCGRTLLMGERSVGYFTANGEGPFDVCELCVPRAHRYGLRSRPSTADEVARASRNGAIKRVKSAIGAIVAGKSRPQRRPAPVVQGSAAVAAAQASSPNGKPRRRRIAATASLDTMSLGAVPVGAAAIPVALAAFNQSPHARTLAGLYRTLGAPRASVTPRSVTDREVIVTVAWEIVWYQFRVMPDGIEQQRGQYLAELHERWQSWNCVVASDGTVREAGEPNGDGGQDPSQTPRAPEAPTR